MQGLEKILKEMRKIKDGNRKEKLYAKYPPNGKDQEVLNAYSQGYEDGTDNFYNATVDIIRKHMNDGWIPVDDRLPEPGRIVLITQEYSWENFEEGASVTIGRLSPEKNNKMWEFQYYRPDFRSGTIMDNDIICPGNEYVIAWRPLPEPYRPERSDCDGK